MNIFTEYLQTQEEITKLESTAAALLKTFIEKDIVNYVNRYSSLVACVCWDQYTSWFNDGEPCEFSVSGFRICLITADEEEGSTLDEYFYVIESLKTHEKFEKGETLYEPYYSNEECLHQLESYNKFPADFLADSLTLTSQLVQIADNSLEKCFGNGVTVRVIKDGVTTDEYEHD